MTTFGATDAFDAVIYGHQHQGTINYLKNQVANVSDKLTDIGQAFMSKGRDIFNHFNSSSAMEFARGVVNKYNADSNPLYSNYVLSLDTLHGLQNASLIMQRYVMANPTVRTKYHKQQLDGYSNTYTDSYPDDVGESHYDYRMVMDTVGVVTEDDCVWVNYGDTLLEGDRELTFNEKVDIIHTWNVCDMLLGLNDDDPTNADGGKL